MDISQIVKLCSRSWCLKALSLMAAGVPARISPVAHAAGCGRTAMTASFEHLLDLGLLQRSPGHGHPLRPEFQLSARGRATAAWALGLEAHLESEEDWQLVRRSWTLPVLSQLTAEQRFSELRRSLAPVSDRALTLALVELAEAGWVERKVDVVSAPPAVRYAAVGQARRIVAHLKTFPTQSQ